MRRRYCAVNCDTMSWPASCFVRFPSGLGLAVSDRRAATHALLLDFSERPPSGSGVDPPGAGFVHERICIGVTCARIAIKDAVSDVPAAGQRRALSARPLHLKLGHFQRL
jgi:hypothetical protein